MPYVTSLRETLVSTLNGHMIRVPARKPTYVPPEVLQESFKFGCVECDEKGKLKIDLQSLEELPVNEVPKLTEEERNDPDKRAAAIVQAVAKVYQDNDPKHFNAEKLPRVKAIEAVVGFPTSSAEVAAAVEKYHAGA